MTPWQYSVHPQLSFPALLIHQRNPELTKPPHNAALLIPDPNQQYEEFFVQFFSWTVWGQWSKRDFKFGLSSDDVGQPQCECFTIIYRAPSQCGRCQCSQWSWFWVGPSFSLGAGFYLYLPCSSLIPGHNLEPSDLTSVSVIVTNNGFIPWLYRGQITLERGLHPC